MDGLYLVRSGVPIESVFGKSRRVWSRERRKAAVIVLGTLEGREWDWEAWRWKKPKR